jgi:hypothetical protein
MSVSLTNIGGSFNVSTSLAAPAGMTGSTGSFNSLVVSGTSTLTDLVSAPSGITGATGSFTVIAASGNAVVSGTSTLTGLVSAPSGITGATGSFTVIAASGNAVVSGTSTLTGLVSAPSGITGATGSFTVIAASGNAVVSGTSTLTGLVSAPSGITGATGSFTVIAASGNAVVSGTSTLTGLVSAPSGITGATGSFTVIAASGNAVVSGTSTLTGLVSAPSGITGATGSFTYVFGSTGIFSNLQVTNLTTVNETITNIDTVYTKLTVSGELDVSGVSNLNGHVFAPSGITGATGSFTAIAASGNAVVSGTSTLTGQVSAPSGITGATGSFTAIAASGNAVVSGTSTLTGQVSAPSGITGATGSFTAIAASGNAVVSGTSTLTGQVSAPSGITGATGSFTAIAASGNAVVSGTSTLTGQVSAPSGITGATGSFTYLTVQNNNVDVSNTARIDQAGNIFITDTDIAGTGPYTYQLFTPNRTPAVRTAHFMCPKASAASICGLGINGSLPNYQNAMVLDAYNNNLYIATGQLGGGGSTLANRGCYFDGSNINPLDISNSTGFNSSVTAFASDASYLYVAGGWTNGILGTNNTKSIAKVLKTTLNTNNPSWSTIDASYTSASTASINSLYLDICSNLFVGSGTGTLYKYPNANNPNPPGLTQQQATVSYMYNTARGGTASINTLVLDNANNLLIGGQFIYATDASTNAFYSDSNRANNICYYNITNRAQNQLGGQHVGSVNTPNINQGVDGTVFSIFFDPSETQPTIYIGGNFTSANGTVRARNIVKVTNYLSSDISYTDLDIGVDGTVYAITKVGNLLYVGGSFLSVGRKNMSSNRFAIWDTVNNKWISTGNAFNNNIYSIVYDSSNTRLYVGGAFTVGGGVYNQLVKLDLNKSLILKDPNGNDFYIMIGNAGMTNEFGVPQTLKTITDSSGNLYI